MKSARPFILIIAVIVCSLILALDQWGAFYHAVAAWERLLADWLNVELAEMPHRIPWQYASHTAVAFISAHIAATLPRRGFSLLFMGSAALLLVSLAGVLATRGYLFEPVSSLLALLGAGVGGLVLQGNARGQTVAAFRRFFVGRVTEEKFAGLIVQHEPVKLSGTREVTTLSCRIINLPSLIHKLEVGQLETLSSAFQLLASQCLVRQGGYLDTCDSHGVTAQFGFPLRDAGHAREACRAALALRPLCEEFIADAEKRWEQRPQILVGLASGPVACGLIGHGQFQSYSVLGEPVERSLRLCHQVEAGAPGGCAILVDEDTARAVKDHMDLQPAKADQALVLAAVKFA